MIRATITAGLLLAFALLPTNHLMAQEEEYSATDGQPGSPDYSITSDESESYGGDALFATTGEEIPDEIENGAVLKWSLGDCLEYAKSHNISLLQGENTLAQNIESTLQAKAAKYPSISLSSSQRVTNFPSADNDRTTYSGSYDLGASMTLYSGGRLNRALELQRLTEQITRYSNEETEINIFIAVSEAYLNVLYAAETVKVNEENVEVSRQELERGRELKRVGTIAKSDLAQLESQYSSDLYMLVVSRNNLESGKMTLRQLLQLDMSVEMEFDEPEIIDSEVMKIIPDKETAFNNALETQPQIKAMALNTEYSEVAVKQARAGYIPSISLSAGIGTSHVSHDGNLGEQTKDNFNESVGLSISIPITSNRTNKTAVNQAKLEQEMTELTNRQTYLNLQQDVESTWLDARSSQEEYVAALSNLDYVSESYSLVSKQFDVGMRNTVELLTEKKNLYSAQTDVLQSKYMTILYMTVLDYYQGLNIEL